jgi:hypothetical protein
MWDMRISRVVESRDVIWLKCMFFKDDTAGVVDLDTLEDLENKLGPELVIGLGMKNVDDITATGQSDNQPDKPGCRVYWGTPLVTGPSTMHTRAECAIKPPNRLTYAPAIELRYL